VGSAVNKAVNDGPELLQPQPPEEELWLFPAPAT
jgi:hypothetical protein